MSWSVLRSLLLILLFCAACSLKSTEFEKVSEAQQAPLPAETPPEDARPVSPPQPVIGSYLAGVLFEQDGAAAKQATIKLPRSGYETLTQSDGEFAIPVTQIESQILPVTISIGPRIIAADITLPADVVSLVNEARIDAGLLPLSSEASDEERAPETSANQPLPLARQLAVELPSNHVEAGAKQSVFVYSIPHRGARGERVVGPFNTVLSSATGELVRISWESLLAEQGRVSIAFSRNQNELLGWDGQPDSLQEWIGADGRSSLVTDYSQCSHASGGSKLSGALHSGTGSFCNFSRALFPFNENTPIYFRVVAESSSEMRYSQVFTVSPNNISPTIVPIQDQFIELNRTGNVSVVYNSSGNLGDCGGTVSAISSNQFFLPSESIVIGGSAPNCVLSVTPTVNQGGKTIVTVKVKDGSLSATTTFQLATKGWYPEAYIKASNAEAHDRFGASVSISGDTLVVGAHGESSNQITITNGVTANSSNDVNASGAVYVYKRSDDKWVQQAYIKASNANSNDAFGWSVALSGDLLAVGAYAESSGQQTITNGSGASADNSQTDSGAVYVFERSATQWAQTAYVKASNSDAGDYFGSSVSLEGDLLAVASFKEASNLTTITNGTGNASTDNSVPDSGAVYLYRRVNKVWRQEAYLKSANADSGDQFGTSIALSGNTLVVGAPGESSNQTTITNGVGVSADNSVVSSGAVYVYQKSGANWQQQAYIKPTNSQQAQYFGASVSVVGDTLAVGASGEASSYSGEPTKGSITFNHLSPQSGAVYVYRRSGTSWVHDSYIKASNNGQGDFFGSSVSIAQNLLVVGAPGESSGQQVITQGVSASIDNSVAQSGALYVYKYSSGVWKQDSYIKAANASVGDNFGTAISVSGDTIAASAYSESSSQTTITNGGSAPKNRDSASSGAVYIYRHISEM